MVITNSKAFKLIRCNQQSLFRQRLQRSIPELEGISPHNKRFYDICKHYREIVPYYANCVMGAHENLIVISESMLIELWLKNGKIISKDETSIFTFLDKGIPSDTLRNITQQAKKLNKNKIYKRMLDNFICGMTLFSCVTFSNKKRKQLLSYKTEKITSIITKNSVLSDIVFYYIIAEFIITQTTYHVILYSYLKTTERWKNYTRTIKTHINLIRHTIINCLTNSKDVFPDYPYINTKNDCNKRKKRRWKLKQFVWNDCILKPQIVFKIICCHIKPKNVLNPNILPHNHSKIELFAKTNIKIPYYIFKEAGFINIDKFIKSLYTKTSLTDFLKITQLKNFHILTTWAYYVRKYQTFQIVPLEVKSNINNHILVCKDGWHPCIKQESKKEEKRRLSHAKEKKRKEENNATMAPLLFKHVQLDIVTNKSCCSHCKTNNMEKMNMDNNILHYGNNTIITCYQCKKQRSSTKDGYFFNHHMFICNLCKGKKETEKHSCYCHCKDLTTKSFIALDMYGLKKTYYTCDYHGHIIPSDTETCVYAVMQANMRYNNK